jgi:hypothetical protein
MLSVDVIQNEGNKIKNTMSTESGWNPTSTIRKVTIAAAFFERAAAINKFWDS